MPADDFFYNGGETSVEYLYFPFNKYMLVRSCCYDVYIPKQENLKLGSFIQDW
jgi:hypothetical protein